jgi:hypothetical protein
MTQSGRLPTTLNLWVQAAWPSETFAENGSETVLAEQALDF